MIYCHCFQYPGIIQYPGNIVYDILSLLFLFFTQARLFPRPPARAPRKRMFGGCDFIKPIMAVYPCKVCGYDCQTHGNISLYDTGFIKYDVLCIRYQSHDILKLKDIARCFRYVYIKYNSHSKVERPGKRW